MKKLSVPMTNMEQNCGYFYLFAQLLLLPTALHTINNQLTTPLSHSMLNFVFFCINFLCVFAILWRFIVKSTKVSFRTPKLTVSSALLGFALYWLLTLFVRLLILLINPDFYNINDASIQAQLAQNQSLLHFGLVLLVPITEELLYRGLIFRPLYNRAPWLGYLVSIFVFAALHIVGYIGQYGPLHLMLCFLEYVPAGICLGWAYEKADSIWAPILIHIAVNEIGVLSMI